MGRYLQASELGNYYPAKRILNLADADLEAETLEALSPATEAYLEARIANAETEADGYLQGRFDLPISPAPGRLKLAVGKIAVYYIFADNNELAADKSVTDQYDLHREWLEGVKEGEMFIGSKDVAPSGSEILSTADGGGGGMVFGGGGLSAF